MKRAFPNPSPDWALPGLRLLQVETGEYRAEELPAIRAKRPQSAPAVTFPEVAVDTVQTCLAAVQAWQNP